MFFLSRKTIQALTTLKKNKVITKKIDANDYFEDHVTKCRREELKIQKSNSEANNTTKRKNMCKKRKPKRIMTEILSIVDGVREGKIQGVKTM